MMRYMYFDAYQLPKVCREVVFEVLLISPDENQQKTSTRRPYRGFSVLRVLYFHEGYMGVAVYIDIKVSL